MNDILIFIAIFIVSMIIIILTAVEYCTFQTSVYVKHTKTKVFAALYGAAVAISDIILVILIDSLRPKQNYLVFVSECVIFGIWILFYTMIVPMVYIYVEMINSKRARK